MRQHGLKYSQVLSIELEKFAATIDDVYDDNTVPSTLTTKAYFQSKAAPSSMRVTSEELFRRPRPKC